MQVESGSPGGLEIWGGGVDCSTVARGLQRGVPAARSDCGPSLWEGVEGEGLGGQLGGVEAGPSAGPVFGLFYPLTLGKSFNHPEPQFLHPQNERVTRDGRVGTGTGERRAAQHAEARGNGRPAGQARPASLCLAAGTQRPTWPTCTAGWVREACRKIPDARGSPFTGQGDGGPAVPRALQSWAGTCHPQVGA